MRASSHTTTTGTGGLAALPAHETLHIGLERLIGTALVDPAWRHRLLGDPSGTVRAFGLPDADAAMVAHIRAKDLPSFVSSLRPLLYAAPARARLAG
jgi:hypothetical protein